MKRLELWASLALLAWIAVVSVFHYRQFVSPVLRLLGIHEP
jgi:hypothetical protein